MLVSVSVKIRITSWVSLVALALLTASFSFAIFSSRVSGWGSAGASLSAGDSGCGGGVSLSLYGAAGAAFGSEEGFSAGTGCGDGLDGGEESKPRLPII
jgi:hypothetical protein